MASKRQLEVYTKRVLDNSDEVGDLCCLILKNKTKRGSGFSKKDDKHQFDLGTLGITQPSGKRYKVAAARAPAAIQGLIMGNETASHLCHNPSCVKSDHIVMESLPYNQSRNYCAGPYIACGHEPPCLAEGSMYQAWAAEHREKLRIRQVKE